MEPNPQSPSSGDCAVVAERASGNRGLQFDSEIAAPVEIENPNWHRSKPLHSECGWKQGESAVGRWGKDAGGASRWSAVGIGADTTKKLYQEGGM
jgi:hypothetical protein